jgi:hypothetical protein
MVRIGDGMAVPLLLLGEPNLQQATQYRPFALFRPKQRRPR